jgi:predicted TIM-barrel fold metal-dependent hydrolase
MRPKDILGKALLELTSQDHIWMKLSSPYRLPDHPFNTVPDQEWLDAFLKVCANRCVWGSDWPHPPPHTEHKGPDVLSPWRQLSYADLVGAFHSAVGSEVLIDKIMWENPAKLYHFK